MAVVVIGVYEREHDRISDSDSDSWNNDHSTCDDLDCNDKDDIDRNNLDKDNCNLNLAGNQLIRVPAG